VTVTPSRALVVEDEPRIRELVALHLRLEGLTVTTAADGHEGLRLAQTEAFDVIVLDLMLPKIDGIIVCRAVRRLADNGDVPILILTARRDESDKVLGLESGADDYLTKPFGVGELVARVRALLRRPRASSARAVERPPVIAVPAGQAALSVDPGRRLAQIDGRLLELTPHEFDVLYLLAAHPGIVFTREELIRHVWPANTHVSDRSVDTLVKRLRQKVEPDSEPALILTVWGSGYKFRDV
jgi:DNA-binding response OmpR family regulator